MIAGVWLSLYETEVLNFFIDFGFTFEPGTFAYNVWQETPIDVYLDFYMFNWTNPEILDSRNRIDKKDIKLKFNEVGPFRFKEVRRKKNVVFNNNATVTFQQSRQWTFVRESSCCDLDENITNVNPVAVSSAYYVRNSNFFLKKGLQFVLTTFARTIHLTKPVGDILFNGYDDPLLTLGNKMPFLSSELKAYDKFGWFYMRNNSADFDGIFNMASKTTSHSDLGELYEWNYKNSTGIYESPYCDKISGSQAEFYPQNLFNRSTVSFFSSDMCRTVTLDFESHETVKGIAGRKYLASDSFLDMGEKIAENSCFCPGKCLPRGAVNISTCRYGSPGFATLPRFNRADDWYFKHISGVEPQEERHDMYMIFEPRTGLPLEVAARLQLNLYMAPVEYIDHFHHVPEMLVPIVWFEQIAQIPDTYVFLVNILLRVLPILINIISIFFIVASLVCIFLISVIIKKLQTHRLKKKEIFKQELEPLN